MFSNRGGSLGYLVREIKAVLISIVWKCPVVEFWLVGGSVDGEFCSVGEGEGVGSFGEVGYSCCVGERTGHDGYGFIVLFG